MTLCVGGINAQHAADRLSLCMYVNESCSHARAAKVTGAYHLYLSPSSVRTDAVAKSPKKYIGESSAGNPVECPKGLPISGDTCVCVHVRLPKPSPPPFSPFPCSARPLIPSSLPSFKIYCHYLLLAECMEKRQVEKARLLTFLTKNTAAPVPWMRIIAINSTDCNSVVSINSDESHNINIPPPVDDTMLPFLLRESLLHRHHSRHHTHQTWQPRAPASVPTEVSCTQKMGHRKWGCIRKWSPSQSCPHEEKQKNLLNIQIPPTEPRTFRKTGCLGLLRCPVPAVLPHDSYVVSTQLFKFSLPADDGYDRICRGPYAPFTRQARGTAVKMCHISSQYTLAYTSRRSARHPLLRECYWKRKPDEWIVPAGLSRI
ncbi:unnamed protein product [Trichogramma brassicae]|uniref:Uncharacterized protein n=1 Tax=Trichogramma brassicae TaxID=86971 RepID=A0A6H5IQZ0_9HYME|nr:unnamed protein product [Trichogramma brassicae]